VPGPCVLEGPRTARVWPWSGSIGGKRMMSRFRTSQSRRPLNFFVPGSASPNRTDCNFITAPISSEQFKTASGDPSRWLGGRPTWSLMGQKKISTPFQAERELHCPTGALYYHFYNHIAAPSPRTTPNGNWEAPAPSTTTQGAPLILLLHFFRWSRGHAARIHPARPLNRGVVCAAAATPKSPRKREVRGPDTRGAARERGHSLWV